MRATWCSPGRRNLLVIIALCIVATPALSAPEAARQARPGDLKISLKLLTRDGTISAYEPLVARVSITNTTADALEFTLGPSETPDTYLEIRDSKGKLLASTPRFEPGRIGEVNMAVHALGPGKSLTKLWVVSVLHQFTKPGEYKIHLQLLSGALRGKPTLTSQDTATVRVLPFDAARLQARCEEIFKPIPTHQASCELDAGARAKILYSVRHDIVLPYLDWAVREWSDTYACLAMRRLGTERAQGLLKALTARQDTAGREARSSLKLPLKISMYDVVLD
ncbi:MAG: hypothetical protein ACE5JM_04970 [Armatimonadota bacterium]